MNTKFSKLALAIGALVMAGGAWAATDGSTMEVTASVAAACSVGNGGTMALGAITMLSADGTQTTTDTTAATATFPAICTTGTTAPTFTYVSTNALTGAFRLIGSTTATDFITYTLYPSTDGSGTVIASGTAVAYTGFVIDGTSKNLALSARIAPGAKTGQSVQNYTDTIAITVTFS
ncbi:spore coat protein U domain-containing protein [Polaromonas sp.]|uniref:spore coat protein U domain-containing protein n=1 Tax=Polaromonas sp. TaxID=1869339 RepID=UPI003BB57138